MGAPVRNGAWCSEWDNAQPGYGFLEFGYGRRPGGGIDHDRPYCENFDVLAHELGHSIIFSQVGFPSNPADPAIDYGVTNRPAIWSPSFRSCTSTPCSIGF